MKSHRIFVLAALVATFSFPRSAAAQAVVGADAGASTTSVVAASATGVVRINVLSGDLQIVGWNRAEVSVSGSSSASISSVPDQSRIAIGGGRATSTSMQIRVPVGSRVEVSNVSGDIVVKDVVGAVKLSSVNGSLRIEGSPSDVEARTVSGAIEMSVAKSDARVSTVSGDIHVRCAAGRVSTKTVSGTSSLTGGPLERVQMRTVSGALDFDGKLAPGAISELRSHSGAIAVTLPKGSIGTFELRTRGSVRNHLAGAAADAGTEHDFTRGSGGPSVNVTSFSGDVTLSER